MMVLNSVVLLIILLTLSCRIRIVSPDLHMNITDDLNRLDLLQEPRTIFGKYWNLPQLYRRRCVAYERLCCPIKCYLPPNNFCGNPPGPNSAYCSATPATQGVTTGMLCKDTTTCDACGAAGINLTCATAPDCNSIVAPTTVPGQPPPQASLCPQHLPNVF